MRSCTICDHFIGTGETNYGYESTASVDLVKSRSKEDVKTLTRNLSRSDRSEFFFITNYQSQHLPGIKLILSSTLCSIVITPIELWNHDRSEDGNPDGKVRRKKRFSEKSVKRGQAKDEDDEGEFGAENASLSSNTTRIKNKLFEDNTDNLDAITSSSKRR